MTTLSPEAVQKIREALEYSSDCGIAPITNRARKALATLDAAASKPANAESEREAFETWQVARLAAPNNTKNKRPIERPLIRNGVDNYFCAPTRSDWQSWQAACAWQRTQPTAAAPADQPFNLKAMRSEADKIAQRIERADQPKGEGK